MLFRSDSQSPIATSPGGRLSFSCQQREAERGAVALGLHIAVRSTDLRSDFHDLPLFWSCLSRSPPNPRRHVTSGHFGSLPVIGSGLGGSSSSSSHSLVLHSTAGSTLLHTLIFQQVVPSRPLDDHDHDHDYGVPEGIQQAGGVVVLQEHAQAEYGFQEGGASLIHSFTHSHAHSFTHSTWLDYSRPNKGTIQQGAMFLSRMALVLFTASSITLAKADRGGGGGGGGDSGSDQDQEYTVWVTPHDSYSSSVGVLGCKINTDRVAYWPSAVDCDNICVSLTHQDRTVKLLRIDQSQGAYDVSYDAWNFLVTGKSALDEPTAGGSVEMQAKDLDASECQGLINTKGSKLPLSAANSMNFLASCLGPGGGDDDDGDAEDDDDVESGNGSGSSKSTWVGQNYRLYNVADAICSLGHDEECELDWPAANQAECPNGLGSMPPLTDAPVYNIRYPSGEKVLASSGEVVDDAEGSCPASAGWNLPWLMLTAVGVVVEGLWGL